MKRGLWNYPEGTAVRFLCIYTALFAVFGVVTPYLQVLLANQGFNRQQIGVILGTVDVLAVLAPPLWGILSDRCGRPRRVLLISVLGAMPAFLLFHFTRSLTSAVLVAVLFGFFYKPQIALSDGFTFRFLHDHGGLYGPVRTGGSVSFIVVILLLEAVGISGERGSLIIFSGFALLALLHARAVRALPADLPAVPDAGASRPNMDWSLFRSGPFIAFVIAAFLGRLAMMSYYHFFTLFLKQEMNFSYAGVLWILGALGEIPVIYYSDRIMKRIGEKRLFVLALLGIGVRITCYSLVTNIWQIIPLQFLHSLTFGAYHTASVTFISRHTPAHMKSTVQTVFAAFTVGLGGICGGVVGGWLAETYGFHMLYRVFGIIGFVGLAAALFGVADEEHRS